MAIKSGVLAAATGNTLGFVLVTAWRSGGAIASVPCVGRFLAVAGDSGGAVGGGNDGGAHGLGCFIAPITDVKTGEIERMRLLSIPW